ncbi:MAG: hemolysin family protein [Pirellulales bacterium]
MVPLELVIIPGMILLNSIFAAYEIALASVGIGQLQLLVQENKRGAAAALRMKESMEASLAVVQLAITLAAAVAAATGGAGAEESFEPMLLQMGMSQTAAGFVSLALVVAPLTVATIILGELVPKVFALRNKEWVCLKLSPLMEWFSYSVWPAVAFLEWTVTKITRWGDRSKMSDQEAAEEQAAMMEIRGAAAAARMSRLIGHRAEGIIVSASRLSTTPIRRIMLPAEYIGYLVANQTLTDALITAHQEMHTRFPVTEEKGNPQKIIGYANFKDIVSALRLGASSPSLRNIVRQMPNFSADMPVSECMEHLIRDRNHIALVREPDGRVVGMITLEDVVEELVGEIHDEFDRMPTHITPTGQGWICGGFVSLATLRETTGIELPLNSEKPIYTLNDWITENLEHPPRGGDEILLDGASISVRKTRNILVQEAFVQRRSPTGLAGGGSESET